MLAKPSGSDNRCYGELTVSVRVDCPFTEPETRRRGGGPRPKTAAEKIAQFWTRMEPAGECLLWTGGKTPDGYGLVYLGRLPDGRQLNDYAHRVAYQLRHGCVPRGLVVRHTCDVRHCCADAHHLVGTQADNIADAQRQGKYKGERPHMWVIEPTLRRRLMAEALAAPPRSGLVARLAREHGLNFQSLAVAVNRERHRRNRLSLEASA